MSKDSKSNQDKKKQKAVDHKAVVEENQNQNHNTKMESNGTNTKR